MAGPAGFGQSRLPSWPAATFHELGGEVLVMADVRGLFECPVPLTGLVKVNRTAIERFADCRIVQHGNAFRVHGEDFAVSVEPLDALWIIETLGFGAERSEIMRRVVIWKSNPRSLGHLSGMVSPAAEKYSEDLKSIRFAMQQLLDTTNAFSKIADSVDEATLEGMRQMLSVFDVTVLQCESR